MNNIKGLCLCLLIILSYFSLIKEVAGNDFTIKRISEDGVYNGYHQINNNGVISWLRRNQDNSTLWDILLYNTEAIAKVALDIDLGFNIPYYKLNNSNQLIWYAYDNNKAHYQIYLYTNGNTDQISDSQYDSFKPYINNKGEAVWQFYTGDHYYICYYKNGSCLPIINNLSLNNSPKEALQINDNGLIVWAENIKISPGNYTYAIYLFKEGNIKQISTELYSSLILNNNNQIVWQDKKFILYLYENDITKPIIDNNVQKNGLYLTDSGYILWSQQAINSPSSDIFYYFNGIITQIIMDLEDNNPRANNRGQIVWQERNNQDSYNIFAYQGGLITKITNNNNQKMFPQINDRGQVVWEETINGYSHIFLANRISKIDPINNLLLDN